ncbi:MAG: RNA methyltransferase [Myxococcota bacterium]
MSDDDLAGRITRVTSVDAAPLADFRNLRDREVARARGAFIAESEVVLRVLVAQRRHWDVRAVLLAERRLDKLRDVLVDLPPDVPVFVAPTEALHCVVGFHLHRGVLASVTRPPVPTPEVVLDGFGPGAPRRVVVLEGLTNHDNVGGVFRNAAAFGADAVLFDPATCDPLYRKAIRVSVGGTLVVPFARGPSSAHHLDVLQRAGFHCFALSPRADAMDLRALGDEDVPERMALLLGTEGAGLRPETMTRADAIVRIDIAPGFDSLNVATASGIALHALRRGTK